MGSRRNDNRRDISIKGETYVRLKAHCVAIEESISRTVNGWVNEKLDALDVPVPDRVEPRPSKEPEEPAKPMSGVHLF